MAHILPPAIRLSFETLRGNNGRSSAEQIRKSFSPRFVFPGKNRANLTRRGSSSARLKEAGAL
jgi:hypothetical protein